jgi:hypothetical protein
MLWKTIYLTLRHFRWTILILCVVGALAIYFQTDTVGTFLVTAITSVLESFVNKVKEIRQQLELEFRSREAVGAEPPAPEDISPEPGTRVTRRPPTAKAPPFKWQEIFGRAVKTFVALGLLFVLLVSAAAIYLYLYF